ncbi:chemotaxis protein methyltransferase CheR [Noviherbaspirillum humi]|uniref:Chemotaxis protein methyltransferase CheR n=1 Tax=Noviherbaspirillum humi TaxID=1688639 RepID=A0A239F2Y6_9BURK|nr:CheR family methyltransferase [Noviherbaspirillum humi]SNS50898.1 chemotaxis protein methyltransferase CheR [Noviherbaspirillum humi]
MNPLIAQDERQLEGIEVDLLLEGLYRRYGADFREYERGGLTRRLEAFRAQNRLDSISAMLAPMLRDPAFCRALCRFLLTREAGLFEQASEFAALRGILGPLLGSYPAPKIWIAESLCPEDVFSVAILLAEEANYDRSFIFATCSDEGVLQAVREGAFPPERIPRYEASYVESGGKGRFADHYVVRDGRAFFSDHLRSRIIWAQYSLATDSSFNEFQLICCRNRLPDFQPALQSRILALFNQSLSTFGILDLGSATEITRPAHQLTYQAMRHPGLFRRAGDSWTR